MPNESVNLFLSIQSGNSEQTLVSLTDKTRALDKETQLLTQATDALAKANAPLMAEQKKLQDQIKDSSKTIKELEDAYKESGDELSRVSLDKAREQHAALKAELSGVNAQISTNQKTYKEYLETVRKGSMSDSGGSDDGTSLGSMAKGLAAGQVGQMLSSSLGGLGESALTSMIGTPEASLISDTLSSAIAGGAAGMIAGPLGAAIGTGVGALSGLISGGTKIFEAQDDAFKDYYGGLYDDVKGRSGEMVESGSTIAGGREQTRRAFSQRLGGDEEADAYLAEVEKMAANTNYEYDEIVGYTKLLLNSYKAKAEEQEDGTKETDVLDVLMALSDATAGLDLSSSDVNMMISGLSRMRTTGKATQEYLNYFRERGIDADAALADSLGVDKSSIADMVKKGTIGGSDAAEAILEYIQKEFGGLSEGLASTYDAMVDNLGDIATSLEARGGDAYNTLRKESVEAEMNALSGSLGDAIGEINAIMGENQARRENLEDEYMRNVLDMVLNGNQGSLWEKFDQKQQDTLAEMSQRYAELELRYKATGGSDWEAGAELEALYEEAQGLGKAYFENSDEVKRLNEIEEDEITAIRENTAGLDEATQASYRLSQELSKGLGSTIVFQEQTGSTLSNALAASSLFLGGSTDAALDMLSSSHAFGLDRVPYDEYPALLHQGERVLTASEARAQDDAGAAAVPIQIPITGNTFMGLPEEVADEIAEIIARKLTQAAIAAAPK